MQPLPRKINSENERHATAAGYPTTKSSLFEVPLRKVAALLGYPAGDARQRRQVMPAAVVSLATTPGLTAGACAALNVSRASVYRRRTGLARPLAALRPRPSPRRTLAVVERRAILDLLRAPRFADQAPR